MLTELPLIIANGTFKTINSMTEEEVEKFLSYLVRFTCGKYKVSPFTPPSWWLQNVHYHPDFFMGSMSLPYSRHKLYYLKRLVRLCYSSYDCKDLIVLSEKLASLHALSYKFVRNGDGTVTVFQISTRTPIVMIPESNLDYDLNITSISQFNKEVTLTTIRKPLIAYDHKTIDLVSSDEDNENCILVEDSSSSSDDDVQIVSYEAGALPPTPPRKKIPITSRPGPACSKNYMKTVLPVSKVQTLPLHCVKLPDLRQQPRKASSKPQAHICVAPPHQLAPARQLPPTDELTPVWRPAPGTIPKTPPAPARFRNIRFLKPRIARPKELQTYTFTEVDLTLDDDEEVGKKPQVPSDLSQNSFLAQFNLFSGRAGPPVPDPPNMYKALVKINMKNLSITQVPFLVKMRELPKRCLCTSQELERRINFIDKYTKKDFECSRVTVNTRDKAAIATVTRKCYVKVKRLNSADLRRWKKR